MRIGSFPAKMQAVVSVFIKLVGINHSGLVITNIIPCDYKDFVFFGVFMENVALTEKDFPLRDNGSVFIPQSGKIKSVNSYLEVHVALLHTKQWIALKIYVWCSRCVSCH